MTSLKRLLVEHARMLAKPRTEPKKQARRAKATRRSEGTGRRLVTLEEFTPRDDGGYVLDGSTAAEVEVLPGGIRIRVRGTQAWRVIPWTEVWINASEAL